MNLHLFRKKKLANVVMKDHVIRCIETRPSAPFTARNMGERFLPEGLISEGKIVDKEGLVMILDECADEWKIKGYQIRFIVPDHFIVMRNIQVPNDIKDDEVKGYLYLELGESIHLPFEDPVFDVFVLGTSKEKKDALLFAIPEEIVMDYVDVFEEVKLTPVCADVSSLCIYRLYTELEMANLEDHVMLIQFDLHMVNVSVFHGDVPIFMRHLMMDLNVSLWKRKNEDIFEWTGEKEILVGQLEDMFTEIYRMMNFYRFSLQHGKAGITKILLTGDHPKFDYIKGKISDMTGINVETIQSDILLDPQGDPLPSHFHLAMGLALKEVN